jgi:IS30 family transposase
MLQMKYRTRIHYTEADKALMWERWRRGESLQAIAQLFDRNHSAIGGILARTGGIRPSPRYRSALALRLSEREEISRGVMAGRSMRTIARALGRAPSTVSREIGRNGDRWAYRASEADAAAWQRARRPKRCKLAQNRALARLVAEKLRLEWSPYQVAGWLKRMYPQDETRQVSHETIYRTLFIQARGALKKELLQHLRRTRAIASTRKNSDGCDN